MAPNNRAKNGQMFDYLIIVKGQDKHIFRYVCGQEQLLFRALLEYARDRRYGFERTEVASLIRRIRDAIRLEKRYITR